MSDAPSIAPRVLATAGLVTLLGGFAVAILLSRDGGGAAEAAPTTQSATTGAAPTPAAPKIAAIPVSAVGAFDPEGDGRENDEQAALAIDRNPTTAWSTERYDSFFKAGVGLVLDAGEPRRLQRVDVVSPTPGVSAEIRVGANAAGPFRRVGVARLLAETTQFPLGGVNARYVLIWITEVPGGGAASIAEVRVRART